MKKLLKVLLVLMTVVSIAGCSSKTTTEKATKNKTLSGNYQVEIKVMDYEYLMLKLMLIQHQLQ